MNDFNDSVRWARAYDAFGRTGTGLRRPYGQGTTQPLRERSRVDHGAPSPEQIMAAHNIRLFPLRDSVVSVLTYNVLQGNKRFIISLCTVLSTKFRTPVIYLVDIKSKPRLEDGLTDSQRARVLKHRCWYTCNADVQFVYEDRD